MSGLNPLIMVNTDVEYAKSELIRLYASRTKAENDLVHINENIARFQKFVNSKEKLCKS